jgi:phosphate-selective porin
MRVKILQIILLLTLTCFSVTSSAQRFLSDYDSTLFIIDTVRRTLSRFENLHFSGYMQPQFQVAKKQGIASFDGGNFNEYAANRFMLRRARIKIDYILPAKESNLPKALFTFQFEATERDLNIRDMFLRLYEPKKQALSITMGLFARPFGYEVNLSSAFRETPERGRMSQTLMPSERDLGAMVSYEAQVKKKMPFKFEVGVFNGQGKSGPAEFDSYKDLISRLTMKPFLMGRKVVVSGGLSLLYGGWRQENRYRYQTETVNGNKLFVADSNVSNIGSKAPRNYYGADVQVVLNHRRGKTEWRAEYWRGKQPGTAVTTVNPGTLPTEPTYLRHFDGAFIYFIQNIINNDWELVIKYDWYDPNTKVAASQIGKGGTNFTTADIKYSTLGAGLTRYFSGNLKLLAYYNFVRNEQTALADFTADLPDDVFTLRMQLRF